MYIDSFHGRQIRNKTKICPYRITLLFNNIFELMLYGSHMPSVINIDKFMLKSVYLVKSLACNILNILRPRKYVTTRLIFTRSLHHPHASTSTCCSDKCLSKIRVKIHHVCGRTCCHRS